MPSNVERLSAQSNPDIVSLPPVAPWKSTLELIERPVSSFLPTPLPNTQVKWGAVTRCLADRPTNYTRLQSRLKFENRDPRRNDVMAGRIVELGRHSSIELENGRKADLHLGDILVGVFGDRYATSQYEGKVPSRLPYYHVLSQGGVLGQVVSATSSMSDPTIIEPLGYLTDRDGRVLNLTDLGLKPIPDAPRVPTVVILGSSMDAGKTTTAAMLVHGLTLAGWTVHAGKLTGTGCAKDINKMLDAGAAKALDFTYCGHGSTAGTDDDELREIAHALISHLSFDRPDLLVVEIADGIIQDETDRLVRILMADELLDGTILAIHDVLSARAAIDIAKNRFGLPIIGLSGAVTQSYLSIGELQSQVGLPIFDLKTLSEPGIATQVSEALHITPDLLR